MSRAVDIKSIHAIARRIGLDEDLRRDVYRRVSGHSALSEMTDAQVSDIASHLRGLAPQEAASTHRKASSKPHVRKVYALWWAACDEGAAGSEARSSQDRRAALNAFISARFSSDLGGLQTDVEFLSADLGRKVAEAIKAMRARKGGAS